MNRENDIDKGLSTSLVNERLSEYGYNELREKKEKGLLLRFLGQLNDPLIYILAVAAVISIILEDVGDSIIIAVVVLVNAVIGMIQEGKAKKELQALKKLSSPQAYVRRNGEIEKIETRLLVPGDIVLLEAGDMVPADMIILEGTGIRTEESALTGESVPVEKSVDRDNKLFMSTLITTGRCVGVVTETGMNTELGKIAAIINDHKEDMTPLQKRLGELGKILSILSLALCASLLVIAYFQDNDMASMLLTSISLAVAAVPEGLPAVVTICLALSVTRMVKVNSIIRKLPAVETLGAVNVVCSDKTGTLTQNKMTVCDIFTLSQSRDELYKAMVLCNDSRIDGEQKIGDPTELALLEYVDMNDKSGMNSQNRLNKIYERISEVPFDSQRKMMNTYHKNNVCYIKGAPDMLLPKCSKILDEGGIRKMVKKDISKIVEAQGNMARNGLRTLMFAMKREEKEKYLYKDNEYVFLGVAGMMDPPREEASPAVRKFKSAGVDTLMITGDHVETAFAIAKRIGIASGRDECIEGNEIDAMDEDEFEEKLDEIKVFARVTPLQKVRIVKGLKRKGKLVAMTGDGVNDAPSLKIADIGVAMGNVGTEVAKQAADMVLADDNFATIEKAIEEGRGIYENIRKTVIFLISSNLGEVLTMFVAVLWGYASPLKSSHILWINLITDSLPALALGSDQNNLDALMKNPPRRKNESLFSRGGLVCTVFYSLLIAAISMIAFLLPTTKDGVITCVFSNDLQLVKGQTYAFTVLGMTQLYHAVGMRSMETPVVRMNFTKNKLMVFACIVGFALQVAVTEVPFLINAFGTSHLSLKEWGLLSILAAFPLFAHEIYAWLVTAKKR